MTPSFPWLNGFRLIPSPAGLVSLYQNALHILLALQGLVVCLPLSGTVFIEIGSPIIMIYMVLMPPFASPEQIHAFHKPFCVPPI